MTMRLVVGLALVLAGPAAAQMAAPAAEAPDPARLAAARQVVDLAYPPAMRATMFAGVQEAMTPMMTQAIGANPALKQAFAADPRVKPIFERFLGRIRARAAAALQSSMPTLFDAYGRAYARRFTLAQLNDLRTFFATPTGQLYTSRALSLLTDPDVAAANQALMTGAMGDTRSDMQAMVAEIKALPPLKPRT